MDGTIPRRRLPEVLRRMDEMSRQYGLGVANVFHAGDGNLHPLILYNANEPDQLERAEVFGHDIFKLCVEVGGLLTCAHGVGVAKPDLIPTRTTQTELKPTTAPTSPSPTQLSPTKGPAPPHLPTHEQSQS